MKEQHLTAKARQRAWKRIIHDTCRSNWAKRVKTKLDLISFNASMKELDDELDKLEKKHPQALEAMADECQLVYGDYAVRRRLALAQGEEL